MNHDYPFTAIGDEPVEARIVAWVLGEASAFEAAELERLCDERPELLVFRRRMHALHGLLTEAEAAQPDEAWALPAEKRQALEAILGTEKPKPVLAAAQPIDTRVRRSGRRALFAIAACLLLSLIVGGLFFSARVSMQGVKDFSIANAERGQSNELKNARPRMVPLVSKIPRKLLEGTPRPMNLPGLGKPDAGDVVMNLSEEHGDALAGNKEGERQSEAPDKLLAQAKRRIPAARGVVGELAANDRADQPAPASMPAPADARELSGKTARTETRTPVRNGAAAGLGGPAEWFGEMSPLTSLKAEPSVPQDAKHKEGQAAPSSLEKPVAMAAAKIQALDFEEASTAPAQVAALRQAIKDQEDKVEERRKQLSTIVRSKGIIYKGNDSLYGQSGVDEDQGARDAVQTFHKIEQEKLQLESQISSLLKYDNDQLMTYAGGIDLPDNVVKKVYPEYQEARRKLEELKIKGLGEDHPTVRAEKSRIETMKRQLDEGVVNLRTTMQANLDLASNRLGRIEDMKDATREDAIKRGLDAQDYVDAKREFEQDQERLQQMKRKLLEESDAPVEAKPKPAPPERSEESSAAQDPYSTFSLNISDASFQVAQAALAKGQRPDPAGIKVEQFYNAVDYGDPSPSAGQPVAVAIEQAAHPVIPGRNLVRIALKTAAEGRRAAQPLRLTLLVDQSGSMVREDRRAAMDKALAGLAGLLTENDRVTVVGFARTPRLLADGWTGEQAAKLAELVNQSASEGGTNLEQALKLGEQLAQRRKLAGAQNRIVLFTDGAANLGDADPAHLAAKVKALRQQGIAFDIAGIAADDLNDDLLAELARNGNGRYYVVGKGADEGIARQLAGAFRPAAENVKVQVRFNPERVGRYKLIGFEKDRLQTAEFRNDAVDAAELAAEEAGVAVYQVEPLPAGSGELGDVSVRFRDTASGQMVERTWTIPHDPNAAAIDRTTPSMQLAALAMLAAEKLRGGPLADAIDFKQLAAPRANVKRFYGNTGRVAEVLRMVDSL